MERLIDGPFARALERRRDHCNSAFAYARRTHRRLDPDQFSRVLVKSVDPIVRALAVHNAEAVDATVEALYDISLELLARDCLGDNPRYPLIPLAWQKLLPAAAPLLASDPRRITASVSNAVHTLSLEPAARPVEWIDRMTAIIPLCTGVDQFLDAGKVEAWRCGMAHYRAAAIDIWQRLPDSLKYAALHIDGSGKQMSLADVLAGLSDPWWVPGSERRRDREIVLVAAAGGFRGFGAPFGGPFIAPPEVTCVDGTLYVLDTDSCWTLHADCFGATLQRHGAELPKGAGTAWRGQYSITAAGKVTGRGLGASFPWLADSSSSSSSETTLAVTLPRSHKVYLVAAR
ncbi:MAG: hypothetical protein HYX75_12930 [Acidobacteria bacterium]|nr:hypothetical protein [Acidobacteriota bacterium]